jgi:hypothetical protein
MTGDDRRVTLRRNIEQAIHCLTEAESVLSHDDKGNIAHNNIAHNPIGRSMRHRGPWRLQTEHQGHGMAIESPLSAEKGDSIIYTMNNDDLGFISDEVLNVMLAAPDLLTSLDAVSRRLAKHEPQASAELTVARQLLSKLPTP